MNTIKYTQENFNRDIKILIRELSGKQFDLIVGINRGGCLPAVCLSHALKIPATMIDYSTRDGANVHPRSLREYFSQLSGLYSKILIVDDLIDSGKAMTEVIQRAREFHNVAVATLLNNTDVDLGVDQYWGTSYSRKNEPRFFDFWWEEYHV